MSDCKNCEAPVDAEAAPHVSAGDCRAAQRKEIRKLRKEVEHLRGVVKEREKMTGELFVVGTPKGRNWAWEYMKKWSERHSAMLRRRIGTQQASPPRQCVLCYFQHTGKDAPDSMRGEPCCPRHGG